MTSFFQKLRKLPDSSHEDYLTEILAYALKYDRLFRERFLSLLPTGYQEQTSFSIETQCVYKAEKRRTDVEINLGHACILIECKLGSTESYQQLDDYARLLSLKGQPHKLLVFLTVNREEKSKRYTHLGVDFLQLRWYDIGPCITNECDTITTELKQYLKAENILMDKISYADIVAFQSFFKTRKKLNDILQNDVTRIYVEKGLHTYNTYQPTVRNNEYVLQFNYGKRQEVYVTLGFGNWWGEHPCLYTKLWISTKKDPKGVLATAAYEQLREAGWYLVDKHQNSYAVVCRKPFLDFLAYEENQREMIVHFFKKSIEDLTRISGAAAELFTKAEKPTQAERA